MNSNPNTETYRSIEPVLFDIRDKMKRELPESTYSLGLLVCMGRIADVIKREKVCLPRASTTAMELAHEQGITKLDQMFAAAAVEMAEMGVETFCPECEERGFCE